MRTLAGIILFCLSLVAGNHALAANILVVASYHEENNWTRDCLKGIHEILEPEHSVEVLYMDTKRQPTEKHAAIASDLLKKIQARKFDLLMLADDNALRYFANYINEIQAPVVFYGVNSNPRDYFKRMRLPTNLHGVLERHLTIPLIRLIKKFVPTKHGRYLILFDDSHTSEVNISVTLHNDSNLLLNGEPIDWSSIAYFDEWQKIVEEAHETYDALIVVNWYTVKDRASGNIVDDNTVMRWTSKNSQLPVFVVADYAVADDMAVGALVLEGREHGADAARMAQNILSGKATDRFSKSKSGKLYFNKHNLERFGFTLPASLLSQVVFQ